MTSWISELPLWALCLAFAASAAAIWLSATRLVRYVDAVATQAGIGHAFTGMLFLGGITSLPEAAAVSTSAGIGNAALAVNNLIGTASINLVLLALADAVYGRSALTSAAAQPATLMQGILSMLLATLVAMLATVGDVAIAGVGAGSVLLVFGALGALMLSSDFEHRHVWEVVGDAHGGNESDTPRRHRHRPAGRLAIGIPACALAILAAGSALSLSADAIAQSTGLRSGLAGFLLIGAATSLPEASSIIAAIRLGRYQMAVGDVFGTNLFNIMLIFLADLVYRGGPVMDEAGTFEALGAALAAFLTGLFMIGLLERRDRTLLRMGYDSLAVLLSFAAGVVLLFHIAV